MSIVERAATKVNAKFLKTFTDSNGYQGINYFLFIKDGKFGLASIVFGTCALCDWQQELEQSWLDQNPDKWHGEIPLEVYNPMVDHIVDDLKTWYTIEEFINHKHMLFGVGYTEENIETEIVGFIRSYNGS
jgi:hypothetical protein